MSRSTRSIPRNSGRSPGEAISRRCCAASRRPARAGFKIKINTVALRDVNEDEIEDLIRWAHGRGFDLTLIETMPMGEIGADRTEQYLPLSLLRARLAQHFTLDDIAYRSGGPARYVDVRETGGRLGFITPMTHNFCEVLQSRARHLHRHALYVSRPGGCRRSARAAPGQPGRWPCFTPPSTRPSPGSPRAMTSSSDGANGHRGAADVDDRRLGIAEIPDFRRFLP